MLRGADLIGLPVIASDTGEILPKTQDIIITQEDHRLAGFLISRGGWTGRAQVVPWSEVISPGPNATMVRSRGSIVDARELPDLQRILESEDRLHGTRMQTTDGVELGFITDLFFSRKNGAAVGYEVCGRMLAGGIPHCVFVSASFQPHIEGRTAWMPPEVADAARHQLDNVASLQLPNAGAGATPDVRDSALLSMVELAHGRELLWDIRSPDGWLIAARGQPVTEPIFQAAQAHNRLRELLRAAGVAWAANERNPD